ncbi:MAG: hypothetical protein AMS27_07740 [Bacteroides sp. SM23_62_1]|nr:MAG: hypothetical protein AMS27_07740 [Bacteroides sp. SM23_62_1]
MEDNNIINTWEKEKHVPEHLKIDIDMVTKHLKPRISKVYWTFNFNLILYLLAILASIVMLSMNLYGYRTNPVMLTVESGLLVLSLIFLGYGFFIFMKIREINNFSKDLRDLLQSKLRFLRFHYEIWLILTAIIAWILTFSLGTLVDNQDGVFRINKVGFFVIISLTMLVFIYGVQKLSTEVSMRKLKAYLNDLEASYLGHTEEIEAKNKKMLWVYFVILVILTITFILSLLKARNLL